MTEQTLTIEAIKALISDELNNFKKELKILCQKIDASNDKTEKRLEKLDRKCAGIEKEVYNKIIEVNDKLKTNKVIKEEQTEIITKISPTIDIALPKFYGDSKDFHPKDFLIELTNYLKIKRISVEDVTIILNECMKSSAASWFTTIKYKITNFEQFKIYFLEEFWSKDIQLRIWGQFIAINRAQNIKNYRDHFWFWVGKIRHIETLNLSEEEVIDYVAQHYPGYIQAILINMKKKTYDNAMKILSSEDVRRIKTYVPLTSHMETNQIKNQETGNMQANWRTKNNNITNRQSDKPYNTNKINQINANNQEEGDSEYIDNNKKNGYQGFSTYETFENMPQNSTQ